MPTVALALHIDNMGAVEALGLALGQKREVRALVHALPQRGALAQRRRGKGQAPRSAAAVRRRPARPARARPSSAAPPAGAAVAGLMRALLGQARAEGQKASAAVAAALTRTESRGCHRRTRPRGANRS